MPSNYYTYKLWFECLKESIDAENRSKIVEYKTLMKTQNFCLAFVLVNYITERSRKEKMSGLSRKHLASLSEKIIQSKGSKSHFNLFS